MIFQSLIRVSLLWTALWTIVLASTPLCYYPSGEIATGNTPCTNGTATNCCGGTNNCLANGLCLVNTDADTVEFGRGSCTDPTWASPECFAQCRTTPQGQLRSQGAAVFECDTVGYNAAAEYCCELGDNLKTSCCKTSSLRFALVAGLPTGFRAVADTGSAASSTTGSSLPSTMTLSTITMKSSSSQTRSTKIAGQINSQPTNVPSQTTSTSTSLQTSSSETKEHPPAAATSQAGNSSSMPSSNVGLNETTKIAVGVAVPVGVLFVSLLAYLVWNNVRNNQQIKNLQSDLNTNRISRPFPDMNSALATYGLSPNAVAEAKLGGRGSPFYGYPQHEYYKPRLHPARAVVHEMVGTLEPQELLADVPEPRELELTPISPQDKEIT